ncbi:MAG: hypothetical protein JWP11_467 [Frankiales bacterium]|jgi:hypothetical protein|nr:hypothetical protein [Frankiales bacterium]
MGKASTSTGAAAGAVSLEVSIEANRAVIRCGRCGSEEVLWTRGDFAIDGLAALFTEEHLRCVPTRT